MQLFLNATTPEETMTIIETTTEEATTQPTTTKDMDGWLDGWMDYSYSWGNDHSWTDDSSDNYDTKWVQQDVILTEW